MKKMQNSYKKSGVNISLANKLVNYISNLSNKDVKKTNGINTKDAYWWFWISFMILVKQKLKDPVIVSCTDGVGTKLK